VTRDVIQAASGISMSRKAVAEVSIRKQGIRTCSDTNNGGLSRYLHFTQQIEIEMYIAIIP
jgi:hypothetical protein